MVTYDFHTRFKTEGVKPSQNYKELAQWLEWMQKEFFLNDRSSREHKFKYLEIGSYAGESLYYISQVVPKGSTLVLCDLGDNGRARGILYDVIQYCVSTYNHYIPLVSGNSTDPEVLTKVKNIEEHYDVCFIDGNHTFDISSLDYVNYGPLASRVCFHDISRANVDASKQKYPPHGQALVAHLWEGIKGAVAQQVQVYEDEAHLHNWFEIIDKENPKGFGVVYGGRFG